MARIDPIETFVERALQGGARHDAIRAELSQAGWPPRSVEAALDGWADTGCVPPVPRPRAGFSFVNLMAYLVLLGALAVTAFNIVALTHGLLNFLLPDPLDGSSVNRAEQARWSLATLVVSAPLYAGLMRWIERDLHRHPFKRAAGVRTVALGLMLTVAAIIFASDAVYTIYALLNGELTLRFALKAAVVAVVAGGVLVIGRSDLHPDSDERAKRYTLWAGAVATLALIGWTFLATGTPPSVRDQRLDRHRFADITNIAVHLRCVEGGVLPATLQPGEIAAYCPGRNIAPVTLRDPQSGAPYRYRRIDDRRFELCADFSDPQFPRINQSYGANWLYDAERGCITGRIR
ncbi:DUF5671 domain-containing protein [Pontivivens nitratireducens]|uniref:DUF5671 domain-containing protein n=1 Tax=Pontivivens nitratireducens TaxID=2758038 RepID=A0A6G7VPP4_9RHOB|nr:DUF5671 domain-containing protein [Pontibrevibacter nitratireducens]QIK41846.1 hypothetical protein G8E03_14430 [Pontibrevibacter nitratireducens]